MESTPNVTPPTVGNAAPASRPPIMARPPYLPTYLPPEAP